jgi:predicted kinase
MKGEDALRKRVVVFFGLIASGKSFVAKAWAQRHGFPYFNTDVVRKQLAGINACERRAEEANQGIYTPAFTHLTYDTLLSSAEKSLDNPKVSCVVLDGSYQAEAERVRLMIRLQGRARIVFVLCSCREDIIRARLAQRVLDPAAVSDGNWQMYLRQKETFEYPEELSVWQFRRIDTERVLEPLLENLDRILQKEEEGDTGLIDRY